MEFSSNSEVDLTAPYYKDYHFQVLKNAIMFEGTQVVIRLYRLPYSYSLIYAILH